MDEQAIWAKEERLWLEGPAAFEEILDPARLMAFPGLGAMRAAEVLESLRSAPRWASVAMSDRSLGRAGGQVVVLAYAAVGRRAGAAPYRCVCTSTYRLDGERWRLVQHQQTLAG